MRDIIEKELLVIHIEIGRPTIDWAFGKQLLEVFADHDSRLTPQTLSVWGEKVADLSEIEDAHPHWAGIGQMRHKGSLSEFHIGVGWHRQLTTKYQAEIRHEGRTMHGRSRPAMLSVYAKPHKAIDWHSFANQLYALSEAQYGFAHILRDAHKPADLSEAREPTWITGERTPTTVPQLGWSTYFGQAYAEIVRPIFDQRQNPSIAKIGNGYAITLTDNILDVSIGYEAFDQTRSKMKALFPETFFSISSSKN